MYKHVSVDECNAIMKALNDIMNHPSNKVWTKYVDPQDGSLWWWCEETKECMFTEPIVIDEWEYTSQNALLEEARENKKKQNALLELPKQPKKKQQIIKEPPKFESKVKCVKWTPPKDRSRENQHKLKPIPEETEKSTVYRKNQFTTIQRKAKSTVDREKHKTKPNKGLTITNPLFFYSGN